jgi:hypothetical protein
MQRRSLFFYSHRPYLLLPHNSRLINAGYSQALQQAQLGADITKSALFETASANVREEGMRM